MAVSDACPVRDRPKIHDAVRTLLRKMNVTVLEPKSARNKSICCGDSLWGEVPTGKVIDFMTKRASQMPAEEVAVYCISCIKSVFNGGKKPRYLLDLIFGETTLPKTHDPDLWHKELDDYIMRH